MMENHSSNRPAAPPGPDPDPAVILDALRPNIAVVDRTGLILRTNRSWREFAGANDRLGASAGVGQNFLEACERSARDEAGEGKRVADGIRRVLSGEEPWFSHLSLSSPETNGFALLVTSFPPGGAGGAVIQRTILPSGGASMPPDAQVLESIGATVGAMAHSLNNVLAPILMALDMLEEKVSDEQERELIENLRKSAREGSRLVREIRDVARDWKGPNRP